MRNHKSKRKGEKTATGGKSNGIERREMWTRGGKFPRDLGSGLNFN